MSFKSKAALNRAEWQVQDALSALANTDANTVETNLSKPSTMILGSEFSDGALPAMASSVLLLASAPLGISVLMAATPAEAYLVCLAAVLTGPVAVTKTLFSTRKTARALKAEFGQEVNRETVQEVRRIQKSLVPGQSVSLPAKTLLGETYIETLSEKHGMELHLVIADSGFRLSWNRIINPVDLWDSLIRDLVEIHSLKYAPLPGKSHGLDDLGQLMDYLDRQKNIPVS